jgi:hypothetical protein
MGLPVRVIAMSCKLRRCGCRCAGSNALHGCPSHEAHGRMLDTPRICILAAAVVVMVAVVVVVVMM